MMLGRYEKGSCAIPESLAEKLKKAADTVVATEIEVKKTVRKGGRKTKETIENVVKSDEVVAAEIEADITVCDHCYPRFQITAAAWRRRWKMPGWLR